MDKEKILADVNKVIWEVDQPMGEMVVSLDDLKEILNSQPERKYQQFTAFHKEDGSTDIYIDGILKYEIQPGITWTIQEWFIADEIKPIIPTCLESEASNEKSSRTS